MRSVIVCPVGTSLLKNLVSSSEGSKLVEKYRGMGIESWHLPSISESLNKHPDGYICRFLDGSDVFEALKSFALSKRESSCPELAGIEAVRKIFGVSPGGTKVLLYPTRLCNSMLCAQVLARVLRTMGFDLEIIPIRPRRAGEDHAWVFADILDKIVKRIASEKRKGKRVFVNTAPLPRALANFLSISSYLAEANAVVDLDEFSNPIVVPAPLAEVDKDRMSFVARVFMDRECLEYGDIFVSTIGFENLADYFDRGIIERVQRRVCISPWARKAIDAYSIPRRDEYLLDYGDDSAF